MTTERKYSYYLPHIEAATFIYDHKNNSQEILSNVPKYAVGKHRILFIVHSQKDEKRINLLSNLKYKSKFDDPSNHNWTLFNSFSVTRMQWNTKIFIKEYENFNNSVISVALFFLNPLAPFILELKNTHEIIWKEEYLNFNGFFADVAIMYAKKHDINLQVLLSHQISFEDQYKTEIGIDFSFQHIKKNWEPLHLTPSVYHHSLTFLILRGKEFTPLMKMILPFDSITWLWVFLTFFIGISTIVIINRLPKFVQQFVFGTFNRNPSLCMAQIFFGIGLLRTPGRNFARFLFMVFTLYCIVIRTAYQSKMFDFLMYDDRQPTLETVQEVIKSNVTVYHGEIRFNTDLCPEL